MPIKERQSWMRKLCHEVVMAEDWLRTCVHFEMGKPWAQTHEDWDRGVASLDFYSEEIERFHDGGLADRSGTHSHRMGYERAGGVVAVLAWQCPLLNLAVELGPEVAAGCTLSSRT